MKQPKNRTNNRNEFENEEESCARTDAVLVKKQDSKSHLRKSVVSNFGFGPSMTRVLDERLSNMEQSVGENVPISKGSYFNYLQFPRKWYFVTKNSSSDQEKRLKSEAEGREFSKILRSREQFIQTVKGQNNFW